MITRVMVPRFLTNGKTYETADEAYRVTYVDAVRRVLDDYGVSDLDEDDIIGIARCAGKIIDIPTPVHTNHDMYRIREEIE